MPGGTPSARAILAQSRSVQANSSSTSRCSAGRSGDGQRGTTRRRSSVDPLGDAVADIRSGGVGHDAGIGAQPPLLGAGVLAQQVPGDPVQPGGDVGTLGLIPVTLPERQGERLGGKVVGQLGADPPPQVAMNRRVVPVEQLREASGLDQRRGDQLGVVRGGAPHHPGPVTQSMAEATRRVPLPSPGPDMDHPPRTHRSLQTELAPSRSESTIQRSAPPGADRSSLRASSMRDCSTAPTRRARGDVEVQPDPTRRIHGPQRQAWRSPGLHRWVRGPARNARGG